MVILESSLMHQPKDQCMLALKRTVHWMWMENCYLVWQT